MAYRLNGFRFQAWHPSAGPHAIPLAFGKVHTYMAGTQTPLPTYQDEACTILNTNPVMLNGTGMATIVLKGRYKLVLENEDGVVVDTIDEVTDDPGGIGAAVDLVLQNTLLTFLTKQDMDNDTTQPVPTLARVVNDPTPANNVYWVWDGANWTQSALQPLDGSALTALASRVTVVEADKQDSAGLGSAAFADVPASGNAGSGEVVLGSDTRLTDARAPTSHQHDADDISDATSVGKAVLRASTQAAARTAIGAGTSSLTLGTGSGDAMPGDTPIPTTAADVHALPDSTTPGDIGAATAAQGGRADTAVQPSDLTAYAKTSDLPTDVSELNNDAGYLTSESDPTVPAWAKQPTKPSYTASEVGAIPEPASDGTSGQALVTDGSGGRSWQTVSGGGAVNSVNGKTGTVVLDADDVGALPDTTTPGDIGAVANNDARLSDARTPTAHQHDATDINSFSLSNDAASSTLMTTASSGLVAHLNRARANLRWLLANALTAVGWGDITGKPDLIEEPVNDGTNGQVLTTDGSGGRSWTTVGGGGGGGGTVTSVAMSLPTGLQVTGSPVTSSGTLAVTYATGYAIPTTAKQSNWDTAYGWGNHASAGYLTSVSWGDVTGRPSASSATPAALGTAAAGSSTDYARADHVHKLPTAGDIGAATSGHSHSDATTSTAGFMSAADKLKLNGIAAGATDLVIGTTASTAMAGNKTATDLGGAAAVHGHTASQISDSTSVGRSVLTAANAGDARSAIGAGTSNLAVGTGSSDAMAGDRITSGYKIAVVSSLPGSPDPNTVYIVTT